MILDNQKPTLLRCFPQLRGFKNNGDNGIRTRGLCVANAALSQLSHVPMSYIIAQMGKITRTSWSGNQLSLTYYH